MPRYFLRIEAVNLGNTIDDTDDLSTRRGSGLMVLNAAVQFEEMMKSQIPSLTKIATGASIGLFRFEAEETAIAGIEGAVREHFRSGTLEYARNDSGKIDHLPLKYATFAVDIAPVKDTEHQTEQLLTANNRWRQLNEPTVPLAGIWDPAGESCHFDCVRPGTMRVQMPENKTVPASASVDARRSYGRSARQKFYEHETGLKDLRFTNELGDIGNPQRLKEESAPTNTHDKLAVFYVDGNNFGKIGREQFIEGGSAKYTQWSESLQKHHRKLLKEFVELAARDSSWQFQDSATARIRLETILWGGDEIVWVVPAWKGWELAEWFFSSEHAVGEIPITYACGLVFCHTKAPIKNIVKLAKEKLGESSKNAGKQTHHLAYEVLESVDDITGDLEEHRSKWLPEKLKPVQDVDPDPLVFDPMLLTALVPALRAVATNGDFPTRQLYRLCKLWREDQDFADCIKRLKADDLKQPVETVLNAFGGSDIAWLHLLQMLPYIPEATK